MSFFGSIGKLLFGKSRAEVVDENSFIFAERKYWSGKLRNDLSETLIRIEIEEYFKANLFTVRNSEGKEGGGEEGKRRGKESIRRSWQFLLPPVSFFIVYELSLF